MAMSSWWRKQEMLQSGVAAPPFRLRDLDGNERSSEDLLTRGPVVLAFFKVSCPVCQLALPFLGRIGRGNPAGGMQIYVVSQDDARATRAFLRQYNISLPALLDAEESGYPASNAFGISHVPSMFLIEPDGVITWALDGFSKRELEALGERAGVAPFGPADHVPEWKAG
jgi:peroxiredoxin